MLHWQFLSVFVESSQVRKAGNFNFHRNYKKDSLNRIPQKNQTNKARENYSMKANFGSTNKFFYQIISYTRFHFALLDQTLVLIKSLKFDHGVNFL